MSRLHSPPDDRATVPTSEPRIGCSPVEGPRSSKDAASAIARAKGAMASVYEKTNDRSIVITAAAADRTSFGCSDDRDLTNFGEAFIRDALPEAPSIRAAFEKARDSIAAREHAEGLTPSMPTAYFGVAMEHKLEV